MHNKLMKRRGMTTLKTVGAAVALALGGGLVSPADGIHPGGAYAAENGSGSQGAGGQGGGRGAGGQGGIRGQGGQGGSGQGQQGAGDRGGGSQVPEGISSDDGDDHEDSDRPEWAGGGGKSETGPPAGAGSKKGDLYGDLWVIERDDNGVPVLYEWVDGEPVQSENGYPQPVDADGNRIPLDEEGHPLDEDATQEVELGRLNVGRSPSKVTDRAYAEAIATLNSATDIDVDKAGRMVVTLNDGTEKTIDSPIENLALYTTLMNENHLPGLEVGDDVLGDLAFLKDPGSLGKDRLDVAASLLAASADKFGTLNVDQIAYMNSILGIAAMTPDDHVDYSSYDYNRNETYTGNISYYVKRPDGTVQQVTEPVLDVVFGGVNYTSGDGTGIGDFSQAADDALQMIEFVHENVPFD